MTAIPESRGLRLIPNVNDQFSSELMGLEVGDQLVKVSIPHAPVSIIARIWSIAGLRQISAPEIAQEKNEGCVKLAGGNII